MSVRQWLAHSTEAPRDTVLEVLAMDVSADPSACFPSKYLR